MLNTRINVPASVKALLARIGEQLKTAREAQGMSREDICRSLKMHINFVIALEEGLYEDLPGAALFFASLRSYARFLRLDANLIIDECKKNRFLFEALQGEGLIERAAQDNFTLGKLVEANSVPTASNQAPAALPKLQPSTQNDWTPSPEEQKQSAQSADAQSKQSSNRKSKTLSARTVSLFVISLMVIGGLLVAYRYQAEISQWLSNLTTGLNASSVGTFQSLAKPCKPFQLTARESVDVKVKSLASGNPIVDRTLFPEESLSFSDSQGVMIEISDPASAELFYDGKPISWNALKTERESFLYKCK